MVTNAEKQVWAFAHRGARADAPENTLTAFILAKRMGAPGLETDAWTAADGVVVCDHDGIVRRGRRKLPLSSFPHDRLPAHIPSLLELLTAVGPHTPISIDLKDDAVGPAILDLVAETGHDPTRIWLCHPDPRVLTELRARHRSVNLVASVKRRRLLLSPRCRPSALAAAGIDVVNLRGDTWSPWLIRRVHRAGLAVFAWRIQPSRKMTRLVSWGVDGIFSDHADRLARFG